MTPLAPADTTRRFALTSALIVTLIATAFTVSIWRYEHAVGQKNAALHAAEQRFGVQEAATAFWRER
ncbi:MAG: hypothetical protein ACYDA3_14655, partial [Gaiellaceae bacterium]